MSGSAGKIGITLGRADYLCASYGGGVTVGGCGSFVQQHDSEDYAGIMSSFPGIIKTRKNF
jgi:hypothetical protein